MKRFCVTMLLCALMAIGATSCKKHGGEALPAATQKGTVRIERFEGIERFQNFSGDVLLAVSNGLRSKITLTRGEIVINFGGKMVGSLQLTGEVVLPKMAVSSVKVPVALAFLSPIVGYGLLAKLGRGEFDNITLTVDAEVMVGALRKHIYRENIPLQQALQSVGLSSDRLRGL